MATTAHVYLMIGDTMRGSIPVSPTGVVGAPDGFIALSQDLSLNWNAQYSDMIRLGGAAIPLIWNHRYDRSKITAITPGDPTVCKIERKHYKSGVHQVILQGAEGITGGTVNKEHLANFIATGDGDTFQILAGTTTSGTYTVCSGRAFMPGFDIYHAEKNSNTDPTHGGMFEPDKARGPIGPDIVLMRKFYDRHTPDPSFLIKYATSGKALRARPLLNAVNHPRFLKSYGELYADLMQVVTEAVNWLKNTTSQQRLFFENFGQQTNLGQAYDVKIEGVFLGVGYSEIEWGNSDLASLTNPALTFTVSSVSTAGTANTQIVIDTSTGQSVPREPSIRPQIGLQPPDNEAIWLVDTRLTGGGSAGFGALHEGVRIDSKTIEIPFVNTLTVPAGSKFRIQDPIAFFESDLKQFLADFRTDLAAKTGQLAKDIRTTIVVPAPNDNVSFSVAAFSDKRNLPLVRQGVQNATTAENVSHVSVSGFNTQAVNGKEIVATSIDDYGRQLFSSHEGSAVVGVAGRRPVPVYVLLGDGRVVGWATTETASSDDDPNYDGSWTVASPPVKRGIKIWEHGQGVTGSFVEYTTHPLYANTNTHPDYNTSDADKVGIEVSLLPQLKNRHPTRDVYLIKLGVRGSTLGIAEPDTNNPISTSTSYDEISGIATFTMEEGKFHNHATGNSFNVRVGSADEFNGLWIATATGPSTFTVNVGGGLNNPETAVVTVPPPTWSPASTGILNKFLEEIVEAWNWFGLNGLTPDCLGAFVFLGYNDAAQGIGSAYKANLESLVATLRENLTTRAAGPTMPVVFVSELLHTRHAASLQSQIRVVKNAQADVAGNDNQIGLVSIDGKVQLAQDNRNLTWRGTVNAGLLIDDGLDQVTSDVKGFGKGELDDTTPSGGGPTVVS
jgi:hypothetical protein